MSAPGSHEVTGLGLEEGIVMERSSVLFRFYLDQIKRLQCEGRVSAGCFKGSLSVWRLAPEMNSLGVILFP